MNTRKQSVPATGHAQAPSTLALPKLPQAGKQQHWQGLQGDSIALAISMAVQAHQAGPVVVITPDMQQAEQLQEQFAFFHQDTGFTSVAFPDWESLPYDTFSPHQDIISERLATLYRLPGLARGLLFVAAPTLLQRLPPRSFVEAGTLLIGVGDRLEPETMRTRLIDAGYRCVAQVMEHGEFAIRGALLDLFPSGSKLPFRVDLFDNEIESIRTFDPDTQRSIDRHEHIRLLPAREFPLDDAAIRLFRQRFRATFEGDPQACTLYRDVSQGIAPAGIEYYLPLFLEHSATLFDYLPADSLLLQLDGMEKSCQDFLTQLNERYEQRRHDRSRPVLQPSELYLEQQQLDGLLARFAGIEVDRFRSVQDRTEGRHDFRTRRVPDVRLRPRTEQPAGALQEFLAGFTGRTLICAESAGRREIILSQLATHGIRPRELPDWHSFASGDDALALGIAPLEQGFILEHPPLAVVPEALLYGERARQTRRRRAARDPASIVRNLQDLEINAPVVHEEHGVGRYLGLELLQAGGISNEYLALAYADGDKLYVPVGSLELISRYTGADPEHAPLHKLGSGQWTRARRKAAERIRDVAAELLDIYARRAARTGRAFSAPADDYAAFAAAFPFEETPDQEQCINQVLVDMQSEQPMDRLVCGDVGFGKTEVAMRAAFIAVQDGRQVALLVPTTLLAQQHYNNFCDRFADWPVRIELLSRFRSAKQQADALAGMASGKVDIAIGTHKLLQPGVKFDRLGLLIIDEEHRFGVRQKEVIKNLRAEIDILTLTATPIPRTLNMSLSGLRDLSIISTPPLRRLAVKTFVCEWDKATIREACLREIKRGGQIYFLHNQVENIDAMARELSEIVPEAQIQVAHGQMRERMLEQVMLDFYHRRCNLLVCSTIIESGIDVPTANTILINRADRFGLAQLHQLRGRVGRSHHRAYAYLLIPSRRALSADAEKRLAAIEAMEELGAGFTLATHDLEIRGAGELLGEDQSGQIHEIGFSLYTELLERAVAELRAGRVPQLDEPLSHGPEIDLQVTALIPDDLIPDVHTRLVLYKRISGATDSTALEDLQVEMIDRFGLLPEAAGNLFQIATLKLRAKNLGIRKIELGTRTGRIVFNAQPLINTDRLLELVQSEPGRYRPDGSDTLRLYGEFETARSRFDTVSRLLDLLTIEPTGN